MAGLPQRRSPRLPEYDYSSPGAYFITICTQGRRCILSEINVGALHEAPADAIRLKAAGRCVQEALESLRGRYPGLHVDRYVIMPNHVHLMLRIEEDRAIRESPLRPGEKRSLIDKAVGFLKMRSSRMIHERFPDLQVWQRSFHDHVIRGERDYLEILTYIESNPLRWKEDCFFYEDLRRE